MRSAIRQLITTLVITVMLMSSLAMAAPSAKGMPHNAAMGEMTMHQHDSAATISSCCDHGEACQGDHCDLAGCSHCSGCSMAVLTHPPLHPPRQTSNDQISELQQLLPHLSNPLFRPPRA